MAATDVGARGAIDHSSPDSRASEPGRPLGAYTAISGVYASLVGGFVAWLWRSGRTVPQRPNAPDLLLATVATHKLTRLIAKDRVMSPLRHPFTEHQGEA